MTPSMGPLLPSWGLPSGISCMCTISNAFEDNDLVSWKKENLSKIMSGKLWHSTPKWSYTHVESLNSCAIILQNLSQEPTCHWIHPQIPDFLKQKEPWCRGSCNRPDGRGVEIAKIGSTLWDVLAQSSSFCAWKKLRCKKKREFPKVTNRIVSPSWPHSWRTSEGEIPGQRSNDEAVLIESARRRNLPREGRGILCLTLCLSHKYKVKQDEASRLGLWHC